ncbi:MAG: T9SS type A sorting domain-containing protein, partial [Ignavibacteria bacterium]|nr:T9SS type A sorting domain-containing protein [Ignavibacteria bacterium]
QPVGQTFEDTVVYNAAENWWGTVDSIDISKGIRNSATGIINYKSWLHQKVEFPVISSTDNGIHRNNIFNNTYRNVYVKGNPTSIKYDNHETSPTFNLFQNYPNPFNPATAITYQLPKSGNVTLKIFDILGNEVKTLVNEQKEMGRYTVQFSTEGGASSLASGMYIYRLRANDYSSTKKMLLLK